MARMQGKTSSEDDQYFAGVDVSKAHLDLALPGQGRVVRFSNDASGIGALVAALAGRGPGGPHLVVLEPTGRYHLALWRALEAAGHGVAPVNPWSARRLAEGLGLLAKTDQIDARLLCRIAMQHPPEVRACPDETTLEIKALYAARSAAIRQRATVRTRIKDNSHPLVQELLDEDEAHLSRQIGTLTAALTTLLDARAKTRRTREILTSIPGIAEAGAIAILAELPEIGTATRGQIAALSGTAPRTRQSGAWTGKARTRGGRRAIPAALHMNALVAMVHNPDLKAFANRLRAKAKHIGTVLTAVLRKLLVLANALVAQNRLWTPQRS